MRTYARMVNNTVVEIIEPVTYEIDAPKGCDFEYKAGDFVPLARRFHAEIVAQCVDITNISPDII